VHYLVEPEFILEEPLSRFFFRESAEIVALQSTIISHEESTIGLDLCKIDPIILALKVIDDVTKRADDVELLSIDAFYGGYFEAHTSQIARDHVLKDEAGVDLETTPASEMDVLKGVEETRKKIDVGYNRVAYVDERMKGVRTLRIVG
jgi:hypothetical protein